MLINLAEKVPVRLSVFICFCVFVFLNICFEGRLDGDGVLDI